MNPKNLYHYTKTDTAIRKILHKKTFRMNNLGNMNDPKENLRHITDIEENVLNDLNQIGFSIDDWGMAKYIADETKILSFSIDSEITFENHKYQNKGYKLQRMWSQYGESNQGICIEVDFEKFIKENLKTMKEFDIQHDKVEYNMFQYQGLPRILVGMAVEHLASHHPLSTYQLWEKYQKNTEFVQERFFTKNMDWAGEAEYRFLTFSKSDPEIDLSFVNSISQVILGMNFSRYFLPSIFKLIPQNKISMLQLGVDGNLETIPLAFYNI